MKWTCKRVGAAILLALFALTPSLIQPAAGQSPRERQLAARDHVNQGNFMMGQNHFAEAIEEYKKALEIDPTNSIAKDNIVTCHINWGNYYVRQRKYPEALKEYQTCLILNPYNSKAMNNINVVKATMARDSAAAKARGDGEGEGSGQPAGGGKPAAAAQPKKEQPSAVILTPMKSNKASSGDGGSEQPQPSASYDDGSGQTGAQPAAGGESAPAAQPAAQPTAQPAAQPAAQPPQARPPASSHPAGSPPAAAGGSLEDLLAAVEVKIYGRKQADLPVIKRLEKLETDTAGATRAGTIKERIDFLRKNYGL